jgi:cell division protein FtsB
MTINEDNLKDDLEKKIDEAEMEAQIEESNTESEPTSSFEEEVAESPEVTPDEKKKPGKARLIFRRILIWLVVIAIAFAGGIFVDSILRYQPEQAKVAALTEEITSAQTEITTLEAEIERLDVFEELNLGLVEEIADITTHITILSARAAVADATLALEQNRIADAKLALDKVGSTLEILKTMLNDDQVEVVNNMLQRHHLILIELEDDSFSAQTDMEVLAAKLNALENTLFASP